MLPNATLTAWLTVVDHAALAQAPLRQKQGMLHALQDLVTHCGVTMTPYVPAMLALTTVLLESVVLPGDVRGGADNGHDDVLDDGASVHSEDEPTEPLGAPTEGRKALTSGSLRLLALLLRNYPATHDLQALWPRLMPCTHVLLPRVVNEVRC